jgi:hypothetical protein
MAARKSFLLRIDAALWEELERWAADELRSANGQVEFLLRQAVRTRIGPGEQAGTPPGALGTEATASTQTDTLTGLPSPLKP